MKPTSLRTLIDTGLLFEINRTVLHPLGLALALQWNDNACEGEPDSVQLLATDDREGVVFTPDFYVDGLIKLAKYMETTGTAKRQHRQDILGFVEQNYAGTIEVPKSEL